MTEQDQEQKRGWLRRFWSDWWGLAVPALVVLVVVFFFGALTWTGGLRTGFFRHSVPDQLTTPDKTLWDWMELLLVPLVLAVGAAFFTWVTDKRAREIEDRRIEEQRKVEDRRIEEQRNVEECRIKEQQGIERGRSHDAALQKYLDAMTKLLNDGQRESKQDDVKRSIARARTVTVMRQLDARRNDLLIRFLRESGLLVKGAVVILGGADLSGADLRGTHLHGADLSRVILSRTNLRWAHLHEADLEGADLEGANLSETDLKRSRLREADLNCADLREADLRWSDLIDADLTGADLTGADLRGAKVTNEQLAQAKSLEGVTLPDGTVHP